MLNFLTYDNEGKSAADRLWHPSTANNYAQAMWRDPTINKWQGPDPVLIWGKGHACIYDNKPKMRVGCLRDLSNYSQILQGVPLRSYKYALL